MTVSGRNGVKIDKFCHKDGTTRLFSGNVLDVGGVQMMFVLPDSKPHVAPCFKKNIALQYSRPNGPAPAVSAAPVTYSSQYPQYVTAPAVFPPQQPAAVPYQAAQHPYQYPAPSSLNQPEYPTDASLSLHPSNAAYPQQYQQHPYSENPSAQPPEQQYIPGYLSIPQPAPNPSALNPSVPQRSPPSASNPQDQYVPEFVVTTASSISEQSKARAKGKKPQKGLKQIRFINTDGTTKTVTTADDLASSPTTLAFRNAGTALQSANPQAAPAPAATAEATAANSNHNPPLQGTIPAAASGASRGGFAIFSQPQIRVFGTGLHFDQDLSADSSRDIKPPFSYATMISQAILSTADHMMSLADIYEWIASKYAFYRHSKTGWQNSIRHNLSLSKAFEKVPRKTNEPGKGMKWQIVQSHKEEFCRRVIQGDIIKGKSNIGNKKWKKLVLPRAGATASGNGVKSEPSSSTTSITDIPLSSSEQEYSASVPAPATAMRANTLPTPASEGAFLPTAGKQPTLEDRIPEEEKKTITDKPVEESARAASTATSTQDTSSHKLATPRKFSSLNGGSSSFTSPGIGYDQYALSTMMNDIAAAGSALASLSTPSPTQRYASMIGNSGGSAGPKTNGITSSTPNSNGKSGNYGPDSLFGFGIGSMGVSRHEAYTPDRGGNSSTHSSPNASMSSSRGHFRSKSATIGTKLYSGAAGGSGSAPASQGSPGRPSMGTSPVSTFGAPGYSSSAHLSRTSPSRPESASKTHASNVKSREGSDELSDSSTCSNNSTASQLSENKKQAFSRRFSSGEAGSSKNVKRPRSTSSSASDKSTSTLGSSKSGSGNPSRASAPMSKSSTASNFDEGDVQTLANSPAGVVNSDEDVISAGTAAVDSGSGNTSNLQSIHEPEEDLYRSPAPASATLGSIIAAVNQTPAPMQTSFQLTGPTSAQQKQLPSSFLQSASPAPFWRGLQYSTTPLREGLGSDTESALSVLGGLVGLSGQNSVVATPASGTSGGGPGSGPESVLLRNSRSSGRVGVGITRTGVHKDGAVPGSGPTRLSALRRNSAADSPTIAKKSNSSAAAAAAAAEKAAATKSKSISGGNKNDDAESRESSIPQDYLESPTKAAPSLSGGADSAVTPTAKKHGLSQLVRRPALKTIVSGGEDDGLGVEVDEWKRRGKKRKSDEHIAGEKKLKLGEDEEGLGNLQNVDLTRGFHKIGAGVTVSPPPAQGSPTTPKGASSGSPSKKSRGATAAALASSLPGLVFGSGGSHEGS